MGVSIQAYRCRIGCFQATSKSHYRTRRSPASTASPSQCPGWAWSTYLILVLVSFQLLQQQSIPSPRYKEYTPKFSASRSTLPTWTCSSLTSSSPVSWSWLHSSPPRKVPALAQFQESVLTNWQPGLMGFPGTNLNKVCHMVNGNRRALGYKISSWNCGRGLMSRNNASSDKLLDIKLFIEKHKPSLLGILESDIHGVLTPSNRKTTFSKDDILDQLHIEGYS